MLDGTMEKTVEKNREALAGVAQWTECQPVNQRITSSIPRLGHVPALQAKFPVGGVQGATN